MSDGTAPVVPAGLQGRILVELSRYSPQNTNRLAARLKTSTAAIGSAGRALQRRGLAHSFRGGDDRWAVLYWGLERAGRDALAAEVDSRPSA